ncbi:MAG TPA: hypothetical protein ACFYD7_13000 [Candidatus Wujingus californicus]|uniref:hypothetical protein n=1 Tax=Candidatus Wujingus californicus TaxID=3367618 RepID=UPI001D72E9BD|nr:hypothetical protein [Planctomycetota bacterium]MDO8132519.1 hypothetical protein [Candidatus Brocadiales bacterium]
MAVLDEDGKEKGLKEYFITRTFEFPTYPTEVKDGRLTPGEYKLFYYKYKIPREVDFKKLTLRLDMIEYLIFPRKADEAPIPLSKVTVPFYSTSLEIMK